MPARLMCLSVLNTIRCCGFEETEIAGKWNSMSKKAGKKEKGDLVWFKILLFVLPKIVGAYFTFVNVTSRKVFINREVEEEVCKQRSFCLAGFHGALLWAAYCFRTYGGIIMVSRSWDGELIDRCLRHWGYDTARGSSSRFGKEALQDMVDEVNSTGANSGMAVDAPRGPARRAKIGAVMVARDTGQPIVPIGTWTTRHIQFNSWDKMILPLPFGTVVCSFGEPIHVPRGLSREEYEELRQQLEENISQAQALAEQKVGQLTGRLPDVALKPAG